MGRSLLLHKPVEPFLISQRFGDNRVCIDTETRSRVVQREADCPLGYESLYADMKGHNGIDLETVLGQSVHAATDGFVYKIVSEERRGTGVEIISRRRFLIEGVTRPCRIKTRYWHLDSCAVSEGQKVRAGDLIGYAGSTGLATGPHLHVELKPVRRKLSGAFRNLLQGNGYFSAVDPEPYFVDKQHSEAQDSPGS